MDYGAVAHAATWVRVYGERCAFMLGFTLSPIFCIYISYSSGDVARLSLAVAGLPLQVKSE